MNIDAPYLDDEEILEVYKWVDSFKLSRPKKNFKRDFSDGFLVAEVLFYKIKIVKNTFLKTLDINIYQNALSH
jgi:hypothetical protein